MEPAASALFVDGGPKPARWEVAGHFLDALARRDFSTLEACLESPLSFRALVPPGPLTLDNARDVAGRFRTWFDEYDMFEVQDASIGQLGERVYLHWRIARGSGCDPRSMQLVEQHAFATVRGDRITAIDLLCSGFQPGAGEDRSTANGRMS